MKKHNFSAGPCILSDYTLTKTIEGIKDFAGTGLSVLEVSHRGKEFVSVMSETLALFKEVLSIPDEFEVILMTGGASLQFCMIPFNFLEKKAAYVDSGIWAHKAIAEANQIGNAEVIASSKDSSYSHFPKITSIPHDADYLHITTNNTVAGTEIHYDMDSPIPLVADMSSDIFSRPIDFSKYALIYGGAQKNIAPAGLGFVIVRKDALGKVSRTIPNILDYRNHIKAESMFHTPPVLPIFSALQTLKWYKQAGGIDVIFEKNKAKAKLLYEKLDSSPIFNGNVTEPADRSIMNITFTLKESHKHLEGEFLSFTLENYGISGIKGHRSVGGFRASMYNAMSIESVQALVDAMSAFEVKHS